MSQGGYWLGLVGGLVVLAASIEVVRRRYVRGRFAIVWAMLGIGAVILSIWPGLLTWAARAAHVQVPLNLLLFVGLILLLVMNMQMSAEIGRLDERTRVLAERLALRGAAQGHPPGGTPEEPQ